MWSTKVKLSFFRWRDHSRRAQLRLLKRKSAKLATRIFDILAWRKRRLLRACLIEWSAVGRVNSDIAWSWSVRTYGRNPFMEWRAAVVRCLEERKILSDRPTYLEMYLRQKQCKAKKDSTEALLHVQRDAGKASFHSAKETRANVKANAKTITKSPKKKEEEKC